MSLIQPDTGVAPTPKHYVVYTDGSCLGTKSGPGGYSAIIICGSERKELAGGMRLTTAYRMEIHAVITALQSITQPSTITVCCDSLHLVKTMSGQSTPDHLWCDLQRQPQANTDLFRSLRHIALQHQVTFTWCKSHIGNLENERADTLARAATLDSQQHSRDVGFEAAVTRRARRFQAASKKAVRNA